MRIVFNVSPLNDTHLLIKLIISQIIRDLLGSNVKDISLINVLLQGESPCHLHLAHKINMSTINDELSCCGVNEIENIANNINNPEQTIIDVCAETYQNGKRGAFLIFTDNKQRTAGKKLAIYITKNKLGTVIKSPISINPNSKNKLQIFIWTINKRNLKRFAKEHDIYDNEEEN